VDLIWDVDLGMGDARARGSDRRFRSFKNCSATRSHAAIPPTKLFPPVAVLRGGFSDGREPGEISFSARKELVEFFFVFLGGLTCPNFIVFVRISEGPVQPVLGLTKSGLYFFF
jgi:hypothetical protein